MKEWRLPNTQERVAVIGRTGSGKTRLASFILSYAPYDKMPWVIFDFKGEELFNGIEHLREIGFKDKPKEPGLYRISPRPNEAEETEDFMWGIHERGRTGCYFDETLQIPGHYKAGAFRALLTQGRSKRIPCILNTQRPSGVSPYVFSEADHFAIFHLNRREDVDAVRSYVSDDVDLHAPLPQYHSRWYDVKDDATYHLRPVEDDAAILARFNSRLKPRSRFI